MRKYIIAFTVLIQLAFLSCRTNGNQDSRAMDADKKDTIPFIRKDSIKTRLDKIPDETEAKSGRATPTDSTGVNNSGPANNPNRGNVHDSTRHGNPKQ